MAVAAAATVEMMVNEWLCREKKKIKGDTIMKKD